MFIPYNYPSIELSNAPLKDLKYPSTDHFIWFINMNNIWRHTREVVRGK